MKFFIDTEFIENGRAFPLTLISIALVCENGKEFYAVSSEFSPRRANAWVKANVLPQLGKTKRLPVREIGRQIRSFVKAQCNNNDPEFWGYYADYDWVVFCQIFGTMAELPAEFPMYCRDLKQWCSDIGNPQLPPEGKSEHNALCDARWNRKVYDFLTERTRRHTA